MFIYREYEPLPPETPADTNVVELDCQPVSALDLAMEYCASIRGYDGGGGLTIPANDR